ncbi:peroxiredoxin [Thiosulfativibrio zosterae]|uniref:thioredoxin-dependent peroxiredoxin n=1 Tax=Thiosulfativibrio zosterae TaxID=2675053 RepID=A0A6F8PN16_9GAMM|nr:peroxiredoxin [Thiosulfativibrio zosterae]BBP43434.1 peroxiredoxin [Thiosulfativibrio zosterae]
MSIKIGDTLPEFSVTSTPDKYMTSKDFLGQFTVLYFYPKDNTPGCTTEGLEFSEQVELLKSLNTQVIGVSKDSLKKHQNFIAKQNFKFELIADIDETLCQLFDVIKLKKNYGKEYLGIERSTFLINPEGKLIHEWRKVSVKGHVASVIDTLKTYL